MRVGALQNGGSNSQWKRRATFTWTNPVVASKWAIDQSTQSNRSAKQSTIAKQWANSGKTNRFHSSGISRPIQRNHQTERIHVTRTIDIDRRPIDTTRGIFFFSFGLGSRFIWNTSHLWNRIRVKVVATVVSFLEMVHWSIRISNYSSF